MYDKRQFIEFLKEYFPEGAVVCSGNEYVCRCRICGDSQRDPNKMRFYISLNHQSGMIYYHCFNCGAGGLMTSKVMRTLCNAPTDILLSLNEMTNIYKKTRWIPREGVYKINSEDILDDDLNRAKLEYINKRLGLELTYRECIDLKLVFSLGNLLKKNNFKITQPYTIVEDYDAYYIGALSINNSTIYLRCVNLSESRTKKKHIKYIVVNNSDPKRFYTLPSTCDWSSHIRINIMEGIFDTLGVFFHCRNRNQHNEIYTAVGSKAYISAIKMFLEEYGFLDCEFHIYSDNDVEDYVFDRIFYYCYPLKIPVYVHYNNKEGEKDYGVTEDRIEDKSYQLKEYIF